MKNSLFKYCVLFFLLIPIYLVGGYIYNYAVISPDVELFEISKIDTKKEPIVLDNDFKIIEYVSGLLVPVNMEFLGEDLLVLEKNSGVVRHIKNNKLLDSPVLDVEVSNYGEQGLLGITSI